MVGETLQLRTMDITVRSRNQPVYSRRMHDIFVMGGVSA